MRRIISLAIIIALGLGFSGCGGSKFLHTYHDKNIKPNNMDILIPKLNITTTKDIGSSMYEKIRKYSQNTYNVRIEQSIDMFSISSGKFKTSKKDLGILEIDTANGWKSVCTTSEHHSNPVCLFDSNNDSKFDKVATKLHDMYATLKTPISYTLTQSKPIYRADSFKYIALYQGKKGNTIKISFREFKDNMARPAFTQDIEYELNKNGNTIVGFKGLRIEVLKATNMNIKYKVVKDYN